MPMLPIASTGIYYEFTGSPSRPALVLSHSLGANLSLWAQQLVELSRHFAILRYDTRGHGQSSSPAGPYSIATIANDVLSLLDELKLERVHFCGISMGGLVGQWLGIHAAERIDRLVLSNTAAKIGTAERWNTRIAAVQREGLSPLIPTILSGWLTQEFQKEHPEQTLRLREMLAANDIAGYAACCEAVRDADFRADIEAIRARTLVICGSHDASTTPAEAEFLSEHIAASRLLTLPAAHISNVEAADWFTTAVRDFLLEA